MTLAVKYDTETGEEATGYLAAESCDFDPYRVQVSGDDTDAKFLEAKLVAGTGISLSVVDGGANETLEISSTITGLPAGSQDQSLRYNGSAWEANDILQIESGGITVDGYMISSTAKVSGLAGTGTRNIAADSSGNLIIDDAGLGGSDGINVETLTGNKSLTNSDVKYQHLDPNGANRTITLPTSGVDAGKVFVIRNTASSSIPYRLLVSDWYVVANSELAFRYDGSSWSSEYQYNINLGRANYGNYNGGIGIGDRSINNYAGGIGIGIAPQNNYTAGIGIGQSANNNYNYGIGIGHAASSNYSYGTGLGAYATCDGNRYAVALGACRRAKRRGEVSMLGEESISANKKPFSVLHWIGTTTDATETELFLDGITNQRCSIDENSVVHFNIWGLAKFADESAMAAWYVGDQSTEGMIYRAGTGNVTLLLLNNTDITPDMSLDDGSNWRINIYADDTNQALKITVEGNATTSVTWHILATIDEIVD